jgi:starch-binding outer membrane protein SusE/F
MKKFLYILSAAVLLAGCKKAEFLGNDPTGEGLVDFTLITPSSGTNLVLNAAIPNDPVSFSWNAAKPGLITAPTYSIVAALRTGGDLATPFIEFPVPGSVTSIVLTQKQIDDALKAKGIADGVKTDLKWSVKATNTSTTILSSSVFNISITRMKDGATPFILLGPVPTTAPMEINPVSTTDLIKFNWTRSRPATGGPAVTYRVLFTDNNNFVTPLFSMASDNSGADSVLVVTTKQISDSLAAHGYADVSLQANLKWTVIATSGTWKQQADYVNDLILLRQIKFYLVGDITGWDINNPWELVVDKKADRYGKVFYTYFKVTSGAQFLFIKEKGNWGSKYGITGGSAPTYDIGYNTGGDFFITTPGIYRLTIDVGNLKAHIQQKQVGVVGNMQGWNPGAPIYGAYVKRDHFLIIAPSNGTDEFKFHDGPVWDNGAPDRARWWGETSGGNLDTDGNGANLVANSTPRTRVIWDGTNTQQLKYEKSPAVEMRVVGDGLTAGPVWDPGGSPQMTYSGNGIWTLTVNLIGNKEIKFLAGNAWGAFDYEDNSGGSQSVGTPRAIKWDGGGNFRTPVASGSYTITLNEHTQTVTFN